MIQRVIDRWGPECTPVIMGGDWNASSKDRIGYASGSATAAADARLGAWTRQTGLTYAGPESFTWGTGSRQAVITDANSVEQLVAFELEDPRHDHRGVLATLNDDRIGPVPELELLRRPMRIRLDGLKDPKKRKASEERVAAAAAEVITCGASQCPF